MEELVTRLKEKVGISDPAARRAVEVIIEFLSNEAPAGAMQDLAGTVPGLSEVLSRCSGSVSLPVSTGHFGGMARLMQAADRMMSAGMTMAQVQQATHEVVAFARERAGEEAVNRIVTAIPGLRQVA